MSLINKIIIGFVTQQFDTETRRFVGQEFTASDNNTWERQNGDSLDLDANDDATLVCGLDGKDEPYLNMEMVQPTNNNNNNNSNSSIIIQ
jgi:hypothetical protein